MMIFPKEIFCWHLCRLCAKIIVIDEILLTSLEDFYRQHIAYSRALSTLTECPIENKKYYTLLSVDFTLY